MKPLPIPVKLFGGVGLALAILAATAFASWRSLQLLLEAQDLVTHTREVIAGVERLLVETLDTQTGARGFVITGDEAFLEPFHAAQAALPGRLAALRKLTADYAVQQQRLDELERLSRARQEIASQIVQTRRERGFDSAALTPLVRRGKETMDEIRQVVRAMKRDEESLLAQRNAEARRRAERTLLTILVGGAAGFGLVGFASFRSYQEIQARQRAEADARRAAAEVEDLYNNAPCGYCSVDQDGVVRAINNTELEMLGYAREEVVGRKRITELLTPASGEEFRRRFPEYVRAGRIADVEFEYVRKDGSTFTGLLSSTAVKDGQGNFVRSRSTVLDITARKQAEAERDRFFHISLDLLGIASATDGRFVRVSPGVTDLLGWSPEEFLAQPYMELIHPDDRAASQAEVERQTVRGEKVLHFENRFRHKDGSWRVLSWRSVPQPGGLMYATARDITERKRMEQELRELNERLEHRVAERTAELAAAEGKFRTLVEQSLVGIYVIQDGHYHYLNPRMLELFGYTEAEFMALPVPEYIFEADRAMVLENIRRRLAGEVPSIRYQLRMLRRDRSVVHVEVHGARSEFNGRPAIMGTLLDITERKLAEERLAAERQLLRTLIDNLPGFIFVKDPAGRYLISNEPHTRLLGRAAEADLLGRTAADFFPPEVAAAFAASDAAVLRGEPLLEREEQFIFERKPVWHSITKVPLRDGQGRVTGLIGIKARHHRAQAGRGEAAAVRRPAGPQQPRVAGLRLRRLARPSGAAAQNPGLQRPPQAQVRPRVRRHRPRLPRADGGRRRADAPAH
jgi:PAS domain S-box-containing protein